jgi:hypothetical protein
MQLKELKYNLYLADFNQIESEAQALFKAELLKYNITTYDSLPKKDYLKLVHYFTLSTLLKEYSNLEYKKNTIFWINKDTCNTDILNFIKEVKKCFPILLYITSKQYSSVLTDKNTAEYTEITTELKEFRYSIDYSRYSFNKIKRFCTKNGLESLLNSFKP